MKMGSTDEYQNEILDVKRQPFFARNFIWTLKTESQTSVLNSHPVIMYVCGGA